MKVLFVEHGSQVSGAQRSLLELLRELDDPVVACPPTGPLAEMLRNEGIATVPLVGTEGSFRLHPVQTPRALLDLARMALAVRRLARGFDVVHANSVRAGLACALVRRRRVVVHVRDSLPESAPGRMVRRAIRRIADDVIAISAHTAASFGPPAVVIHNPIDLERFTPEGPVADVPGRGPLVGVFGQLTPWKAQDDAIRALPEGARLIVVGEAKFVAESTAFDNLAYERSLHELAGSSVAFLGERDDVPELMRACDLVLVPSWEEPFGRVVVEAMACQTAVLATDRGGPAEIIEDGVDGVLLPPRSPDRWRDKAAALLEDEDRREAMAAAAARSARRFGAAIHAARVRKIHLAGVDVGT